MTARSRSVEAQRADELRARVLDHTEAWRALLRPVTHDFGDSERSIFGDDRRLSLSARDPYAVALEYDELRLAFWDSWRSAGELRLIARRCVAISRHLARRCSCHCHETGARLLRDELAT